MKIPYQRSPIALLVAAFCINPAFADDSTTSQATTSSFTFTIGPGENLSVDNDSDEIDYDNEQITVTESSDGTSLTQSVSWNEDDLDGDGVDDTLSFDIVIQGYTGSTYNYDDASMSALGEAVLAARYNDYWGVDSDEFLHAGETLSFNVANLSTSASNINLDFNGFSSVTLTEPNGGHSHVIILGQGTNLDTFSFNTPTKTRSLDDVAQLLVTGGGSYHDWREAAVSLLELNITSSVSSTVVIDELDSDTESDTDTDTETDTESNTDTELATGTESDTDTESAIGTESDELASGTESDTDTETTTNSDEESDEYIYVTASDLNFTYSADGSVAFDNGPDDYDETSEELTISTEASGNSLVHHFIWTGDDLDGDGSDDTLSFDLVIAGYTGSTYTQSDIEAESSMTALGSEAAIVTSDEYWSVGDNEYIDDGETITFKIENITSSTDVELEVSGISSVTLVEPNGGRSHVFIEGQGTGVDSFTFSTSTREQSFEDITELTLTSAGSNNFREAAIYNISFEISIVEDQTWMTYLPEFLNERIGAYSWDTPKRFVYIRKNGDWTEEEMDIIASASDVLGVADKETFNEVYPDKLYGIGYMNLEKDYGSGDLDSGHFLTNPEHYLYNEDGSVLTGNGYPYYNLAVPEMREYWLSEVERQIQEAIEDGFTEPGYSFSIDGLLKAYDVGSSTSTYVDFWGEPVADTYRDEALKPLLAEMRDTYADKVILTGNFMRPNRPNGMMDYVLDYIHNAYIELFERYGDGYVSNANKGIQYIQEAVDAGKMIELSLTKTKPTPVTELSLDEMRAKASAAMPEFWSKIESDEQDELAELYAYFDFKLAMFLIAAGDYSYLKFHDTPLANSAGTDLFKNITPFPEWDMALGEPLEDGQQDGNVWTRRFEHVEIVLDLDNGTCSYLEPGSLSTGDEDDE